MIRCRLALSLIVVMGLGSAAGAFGQTLQVGGHVGAVFSRLGGAGDYDTELGLSVGIIARTELGRVVGFYPELGYVSKGASVDTYGFQVDPITGNLVESTLTQTVNLHYLELYLPVALQTPVDGQTVRPRLYAGPSLALELDCSADIRLRTTTLSPTAVQLDLTEQAVASGGCADESDLVAKLFAETVSLDLGLVFGLGLDIVVKSGAVSGEVRYDLGLKDITTGDDGSLRNRALHILVGYSHHLGSN